MQGLHWWHHKIYSGCGGGGITRGVYSKIRSIVTRKPDVGIVTCPVMPVIIATFFVFVASERSAGLEHCAMFDSLSFLLYSLFVCFFKSALNKPGASVQYWSRRCIYSASTEGLRRWERNRKQRRAQPMRREPLPRLGAGGSRVAEVGDGFFLKRPEPSY